MTTQRSKRGGAISAPRPNGRPARQGKIDSEARTKRIKTFDEINEEMNCTLDSLYELSLQPTELLLAGDTSVFDAQTILSTMRCGSAVTALSQLRKFWMKENPKLWPHIESSFNSSPAIRGILSEFMDNCRLITDSEPSITT